MVLNRPIQINVGSKCIVKSLTLAVAQYKSNIQRGFFAMENFCSGEQKCLGNDLRVLEVLL